VAGGFHTNNTVLIAGTPEPKRPARDLHHDFIQMPNIAGAGLSAA
jgi:hypothetical protein